MKQTVIFDGKLKPREASDAVLKTIELLRQNKERMNEIEVHWANIFLIQEAQDEREVLLSHLCAIL